MILHFPIREPIPRRQVSIRSAVAELARGVCVVTAGRQPTRIGFVPASVAVIAAAPLELVLCLNGPMSAYPKLAQYQRFVVNALSVQHRELAEHFGDGFGEFVEA